MPSFSSSDWLYCNGFGESGPPFPQPRPTRRKVIGVSFAAALAAWAQRSALAQVSLHPSGTNESAETRDVLVNLFLRGGADGLSVVVPYGDDDYYRARPTLGLAKPLDKRQNANGGVHDLNGFFGLHPALSALAPLFHDGTLAVVHAVGSGDQTRSHFEAMAAMERGVGDDAGREQSGWLARYLTAYPADQASPLRAAAWSDTLPGILRGAPDVSVLTNLADFKLDFPAAAPKGGNSAALAASLAALYTGRPTAGGTSSRDAVLDAGRETLHVLETLRRVDPAHYQAGNGAKYPDTQLGGGFKQVACLIKANVGLEAACLDRGGWDTHVAQGGATGFLAEQLRDVGDSLAAFLRDLGTTHGSRVTVVVTTEFGRRVVENSGLGTDHGRASAAFVLGGNVLGGKVYGTWPGLATHQLEPPGDLRVTTDYRTILGEVVVRRMATGANLLPSVFPDAPATPFLGMVRPRTAS